MIVAIEGLDGAGKGTLAQNLLRAFQRLGRKASIISFPQYGRSMSSAVIARVLNSPASSARNIDPQLLSLAFALDRFEAKSAIDSVCGPDLLIVDRYIASNVAYQCARVGAEEVAHLYEFIVSIETKVLGLPKPDLNLLIDLRRSHTKKLLRNKQQRTYTSKAADAFEESDKYQSKVYSLYKEISARSDLGSWHLLDASAPAGIRSPEEIASEAFEVVCNFIEGIDGREHFASRTENH